MASEHDERRARQRTAVAVEVKLHAPEHHFVLLSRTLDNSPHGAFVRTSSPLPAGTHVRISFQRGESRNPLTLEARVVRSGLGDAGRVSGIALQFVELSQLDETILGELIGRSTT